MFKEKLIMANSKKTFILVEQSKLVDRLCANFTIPVECVPCRLYVFEKIRSNIQNLSIGR